MEEASLELARVTRSVAEVEPFLTEGLVKVTSGHRPVDSEEREQLHTAMGLDPQLSFINDLIQASLFAEGNPIAERELHEALLIFLDQTQFDPETFDLPSGLEVRTGSELMEAIRGVVESIGAAALEVSWQVAAISEVGGWPDPYVTSRTELAFLERLLEAGSTCSKSGDTDLEEFAAGAGAGRHLRRLAAGSLPRFDPTKLSVGDLVALRKDGLFEQWRTTLGEALDSLDGAVANGHPRFEADQMFAEKMDSAAQEANLTARKSALLTRAGDGAVMATISAAWATLDAGLVGDPLFVGGSLGLGAAASLMLWDWLKGRSKSGDRSLRRHIAAFNL